MQMAARGGREAGTECRVLVYLKSGTLQWSAYNNANDSPLAYTADVAAKRKLIQLVSSGKCRWQSYLALFASSVGTPDVLNAMYLKSAFLDPCQKCDNCKRNNMNYPKDMRLAVYWLLKTLLACRGAVTPFDAIDWLRGGLSKNRKFDGLPGHGCLRDAYSKLDLSAVLFHLMTEHASSFMKTSIADADAGRLGGLIVLQDNKSFAMTFLEDRHDMESQGSLN